LSRDNSFNPTSHNNYDVIFDKNSISVVLGKPAGNIGGITFTKEEL
jgi:hypothetical protein